MKLTLENDYGKYTVETDKSSETVQEMLEFFQGILAAAGYQVQNGEFEYVRDEEEELSAYEK